MGTFRIQLRQKISALIYFRADLRSNLLKPQIQMTKILLFAFLAVLLLAAPGFSQPSEKASNSERHIPAGATIEIVLINTPGINDETSRWEIDYQFGMVTDALLIEAHKRGDDDRIDDLIKQGSITQPLKPTENRKVTLQFPLNSDIQTLLMNQPSVSSEASMRQMTLEQSRERERRAQNFRFRSIVEIYDARLQRKVIVPLVGAWPYAVFPDARFEISIQIDANGAYVVKYPRPNGGGKTEIIKTHE